MGTRFISWELSGDLSWHRVGKAGNLGMKVLWGLEQVGGKLVPLQAATMRFRGIMFWCILTVQTASMTALCRCAVGNVGLNVGIEKVELHVTQPRIERFKKKFCRIIRRKISER